MNSTTKVTCNPSASGTLPNLEGLGITTLEFNVPANVPNGAVILTYSWSDSTGQTGNDTSNDTFLTTATNPGGPLATPAGAAAAGVALLAIGGVVVVRRPRRRVTAN